MKDRPRPSDAGKAVKPRAGFTVWTPPDVTPIVSDGVRAIPMGSPSPEMPRRTRKKRAAKADSVKNQRGETPRGAAWKIPDRWTDLAAPGGDVPGDQDAMAVPPEVEALAKEAMGHWKMKVSAMKVMATKPEKGGAIWRIETDRGPRSLKLLHRPPARSLFSVGLQDYLVTQGARVPALVPSKAGGLSVEIAEKLWIVTDWIEPLVPAGKDLAGAQALCYGLGEFHKWSKGYVPPAGAQKASRLYRWPKAYAKMLAKIDWFRQIAEAYREAPAAQTVLTMADQFAEQARQAIARLERSRYGDLVARGEPHWGVVHQDYGWSNGQIGNGGVWIIDLDGVAYDLPIRDLRKLITSTMDDMGVWDTAWMQGMIDAYSEANPIDEKLLQVLLVDMSLPNEFYKHVKDCVVDPVTVLGPELDTLLRRLEQSDATKWQALRELGLDTASAASPPKKKGGRRR